MRQALRRVKGSSAPVSPRTGPWVPERHQFSGHFWRSMISLLNCIRPSTFPTGILDHLVRGVSCMSHRAQTSCRVVVGGGLMHNTLASFAASRRIRAEAALRAALE